MPEPRSRGWVFMSEDGVSMRSEVERLLVVDDEGPILHALQRTFEAAGYEVTACLDPAEALDHLKEKEFQVLSADYMMPGMTGAEFLARARALQPETIRILITAAHDFSAAVDAINNGEIFRILAKPWNRVELLGTVRQAFDTYALREKNRQLTALVQRQNGELAYLNKGLEKLVQRIEFLREGSEIVLQHQEAFDGSGHPAGLKGESIVLGARLFAVADTYDAITSDRRYRRAQPHAAAVAEILRVSNTQLDPRVVDVFCSVSEADWMHIRAEVEQISLREAQWGWTPPKRVFDL